MRARPRASLGSLVDVVRTSSARPDADDSTTPAAPPVVAVVVTHNPGKWFAEALGGLAAQDYPALETLVIDAASETAVAGSVADILPRAHVKRIDGNPGYGAAANEAIPIVKGAAFYLLCHDDVALNPDAVRVMVEEAFKSNAGVVGPKLVRWDEPRQLAAVGLARHAASLRHDPAGRIGRDPSSGGEARASLAPHGSAGRRRPHR